MRRCLLVFLLALAASCSSDPEQSNSQTHDGTDSGDNGDMAVTDAGTEDSDATDPDASGGSECVQVTVDLESFGIEYSDDVGVEYRVGLEPDIAGDARELALLFERYGDTEYQGTFELGTGADGNFGTCAHCVWIPGDNPERAYFADRGTLTSNTDPYGRRADFEVSNLRLIEVAVETFTRESTPIEGGACIEVADFTHEGNYPVAGWLCPDEQYNDGEACHCGCGAVDPDCGGPITCLPGGPPCTPRDELPVVGCTEEQVCAFEPINMTTACTEPCDWLAREGCTSGTCVFDSGGSEGDLCIADGPRIAADTELGETCPSDGLQKVCNVVNGFAEGYCGPNDICRPLCESDDVCTVAEETCRFFFNESPLGYCGPEPTDG